MAEVALTGRRGFKKATMRGGLPVNLKSGRIGLSFNVEGGEIVRLELSVRDLRWLIKGAIHYLRLYRKRVQSPISSGRPSIDGSVVPGQSQ